MVSRPRPENHAERGKYLILFQKFPIGKGTKSKFINSSEAILSTTQTVIAVALVVRRLVWSGHALFAEEVPRSEQRNRGFFAALGDNRELSLAQPKIEQTVGTVSLR